MYIPKVKGGGVYVIICPDKKKAYVGSTIDLRSRLKAHQNALKRKAHPNNELMKDFKNHKMYVRILKRFENVTIFNSDFMRLCEKCYMLSLLKLGYSLYNISSVYTKHNQDPFSYLQRSIVEDLLRYLKTYDLEKQLRI